MHDFSCSDPDDMNFPLLADRTRFFKEEKEGIESMSKVMEDMCQEAMEKGMEKATRDIVRNMIRIGKLTLSSIAEMTGLTLEEVERIKLEQPS